MNRDPFYQQIIEHLGKELDPKIFELCVADLLRESYLGLVPIPGGQDAGMDGAIADGKGEPFPLIATTQEDVIANLTKSLKSYKETQPRKLAVLATSQALSPQRIRNLHDRARQLGFSLIGVHIREDIANRLYHSPKWCKELLNLSGRPSALSLFPKSDRLILNNQLVGRDEAIKWLQESQGDRLIVGQPGSGKSYLLHRYAMDGNGLFVVDEDREAIANGIRSQKPSVLIVDDAQIHLSLLTDLKQIKKELGAEFSILASCWVGDKDIIQQSMNLPPSQIFDLELLTRSQIVEVVHDVDLGGPDELIHEIVNQSAGRPGLAATLAYLSLQGGVKNVVLGDIISNSIRKYFEPKFGRKVIDILAAFSIGGNVGMKIQDIAQVSQLPIVEVHQMVTELGTGGVMWERNEDLSVHPATLRHALVRDVFLNQNFSLPIHEYIAKSPSLDQTAHTLIGACHQGAKKGHELIRNLLESGLSDKAWEEYAWLGEKEATWILENHPGLALAIARPALVHIPKLVIPLLFEKAIGDNRQLSSAIDHPLRIIEDWIKEALPGSNGVIKSRKALISISIEWLLQGKVEIPGFHALEIAYSPSCMTMRSSPGSENTILIRQGFLLPEEMIAIQGCWSDVIQAIKAVRAIQWMQLEEIAHSWAYPEWHDQKLPQSTREIMRSFAQRVLTDIVGLAASKQSVLHWAKQFATDAKLDIEVSINPEFETLYPIETRQERFSLTDKQKNRINRLAHTWSEYSPAEIAEKVANIEHEAQTSNIHSPRRTPYICSELSKTVAAPKSWAKAFIEANCQADLVLPFLQKSAELGEEHWTELAKECLSRQDLRGTAITVALTTPDVPKDLVDDVFANISEYGSLIETHCIRKEISEETLIRLLQHPNTNISTAAAQGEWYANDQKGVRPSLEKEWQSAVIRSRDDHFVSSAVSDNPDLSYEWLMSLLPENNVDIYQFDQSIKNATRSLFQKDKYQFLDEIPANYRFDEFLVCLVGDDLDLYRTLLKNKRLKHFHLAPLEWKDGETWIMKAKLAMDYGYSADEVAYAAYQFPMRSVSWTGKESAHLQEWLGRLEKLCSSSDQQIQDIGVAGKGFISAKLERALKRERFEEIYGHDEV